MLTCSRAHHVLFVLAAMACCGVAPILSGSTATAGQATDNAPVTIEPPAVPNALPEESRPYSREEAIELSKKPERQMVLYYDASIERKNVLSILGQTGAMRKGGYPAIALHGAKDHPLEIFIDGGSAPQLKFSAEQIWGLQPTKFGIAFYNKFVGKPAGASVEASK